MMVVGLSSGFRELRGNSNTARDYTGGLIGPLGRQVGWNKKSTKKVQTYQESKIDNGSFTDN